MISFLGLGLIGNRLKGEGCAICSEQRTPSNTWHLGQKSASHPGGRGKFSEPVSSLYICTHRLAAPGRVNVKSAPTHKLMPS